MSTGGLENSLKTLQGQLSAACTLSTNKLKMRRKGLGKDTLRFRAGHKKKIS